MRILNFANVEKVNKELEKLGKRNDIPKQYGYKFPMDSIEEIRVFHSTIDINDRYDEAGNQRFRKLELVITIKSCKLTISQDQSKTIGPLEVNICYV